MLAKLLSRLSYANVISTIALFCALAGVAYAADLLPPNSVGPKQLKRNAVTSPKVKDGTLMNKDFKPGQLPAGARGPSNAYTDFTAAQIAIASSPGTLAATLALPAGNWAIFGRVNVFNNGILATGECNLLAGATPIDTALFKLQTSSGANELPLSLHAVTTTTGPTAIQMFCEEESTGGTDFRISERRLTAIQVETLTQQ